MDVVVVRLHFYIPMKVLECLFGVAKEKKAFCSFKIACRILLVQTDSDGKLIDRTHQILGACIAQASEVEVLRKIILSFFDASVDI